MSWLKRATHAWQTLRDNRARADTPAPELQQRPSDPSSTKDTKTQKPDPFTAEEDVPQHTTRNHEEGVPFGIKVAGAWAWRFLVLAAAVWVLIQVVGTLQTVIIPIAIALLLAALFEPMTSWMRKHHVPAGLASAVALIGGLAVIAGVLTIVTQQFVKGFADLSDNVEEGIATIRLWLNEGPLHMDNEDIDNTLSTLGERVSENRDWADTALSTANTAGQVITGFFLVLFVTFFFLKDGRSIWGFCVKLLPLEAHTPVDVAGTNAWQTLVAYVRTTVIVAFVDALGIGLALYFLDVPLALPITALVFLTAFIPIIGATFSGIVAVLVALVAQGPIVAALVLLAVLVVQQLEGNVLQPLLMSRSLSLHPLAIVLAIAGGAVLAGVVGMLIAVPLIAVINTGIRSLRSAISLSTPEIAHSTEE